MSSIKIIALGGVRENGKSSVNVKILARNLSDFSR